MIREEALVELKERVACAKYVNEEYADMVDVNALEVAVKALEQEPCEDAISRKEILNRLEESGIYGYFEQKWMENKLEEVIKSIPSVMPKSETVTEFADRCRECGAKYGKLLKQEPCEDCVSRQYLVEKAVCWDKHFADGIRYVALTDILNAPPVTPQTKTGHWIDTGSGQECSECGEIQYGYDNFRHFCANCGSRMEVYDATDN